MLCFTDHLTDYPDNTAVCPVPRQNGLYLVDKSSHRGVALPESWARLPAKGKEMRKAFFLVVCLLVLCLALPAGILEDAGITVEDLETVAAYCRMQTAFGHPEAAGLEYKFALAAAAMGSGDGMLYLGELVMRGVTESDDPVADAFHWWTMAGERGQATALQYMGLCYEHKSIPGGGPFYDGIDYDASKALGLYIKATELGDMKAPRYAGLCYQDGIGTGKDEVKALEYFKIAAERGDSTGIMYTADYLLSGRAGEKDSSEAISLYKWVVDTKGHDAAICALKLGDVYSKGIHAEKDIGLAESYYRLASDYALEKETADSALAALAALRP